MSNTILKYRKFMASCISSLTANKKIRRALFHNTAMDEAKPISKDPDVPGKVKFKEIAPVVVYATTPIF